VRDILIDDRKNLWFGTVNGVVMFDGNEWTYHYNLSDTRVLSLGKDLEGNIWAGTCTGGVNKFDSNTWVSFDTSDGLTGMNVCAIETDREGNIWFGTWWRGISKYDGDTWISYDTANGMSSSDVNDLVIDSDNNIWVATDSGVNVFDGTKWMSYNVNDGLIYNNVWCISIDPNGIKWFGTFNGVSRFDGTTWTNYNEADGLAGSWVESISIDSSGDVWFGSDQYDGGVTRLEHSSDINNGTVYSYLSKIHLKTVINPNRNITEIIFNLPSVQNVRLNIYTVNGTRVKKLLSGKKNKGKHTVTFSNKSLASGIYFCRLETEKNGGTSRKIAILK
jgi:ligand-binding sensor domain-containing protein